MKPNGLRSLLDVLKVHAPQFVSIGEMYGNYMNGLGSRLSNPNALPDDSALTYILKLLDDLRGLCQSIELPVSARSLERTIEEFQQERPTDALCKQRISEWYRCFTSELESRLFLLVLPRRVTYCNLADGDQIMAGEQTRLFVDSLSHFPNARHDAFEAGNCLAFERFTACVYHLMRCAEYGLLAVAITAGVPEEKRTSWDRMIQGIESFIKTTSSTKPTSDWLDQVKKYSDLCSWFTTIKNGWRNPVSHVPRIYLEATASAMFSATRTLFEHLHGQGFKEVPMPAIPIPLPED